MPYEIEIRIDSTLVGHAFIAIYDGSSPYPVDVIGLYPDNNGNGIADSGDGYTIHDPINIPIVTPVPGIIRDDTNTLYDQSYRYQIDQKGFNDAIGFIDWAKKSGSITYSITGTQCSWFAVNVLREAGIIPKDGWEAVWKHFTQPIAPFDLPDWLPSPGDYTDPNNKPTTSGDVNGNGIPDIHESKINVGVKTGFEGAGRFVQPIRRDPLTLDLDGDGLETVGTAAGILFDQTGSGVKQGTGWVKADDGFLVLDRNGNGTIDSGRELFGDSTIKSNGQTALDGFDALADLDSNADGKITSADTQFNSLRVWRDLNQDGISQSGELSTLASLQIASINVSSSANSQTLANGNQIADLGTYTKTDGSTGTTAEVSGTLGDINLGADVFHRQFTDTLDTSAVASLPDMQACPERSRRGSGAVRDLREAANDGQWRKAA